MKCQSLHLRGSYLVNCLLIMLHPLMGLQNPEKGGSVPGMPIPGGLSPPDTGLPTPTVFGGWQPGDSRAKTAGDIITQPPVSILVTGTLATSEDLISLWKTCFCLSPPR